MKQLAPRFVANPRERGQHVVGLEAFAGEHGNRQRLEHLLDLGNLADQLVGHFAALGLVAVVQLVAKRRAGQVERADQRVGLLLLDEVQHVADEAEHGADLLAARAAHFRQGVKDLEDQRMGVDDVDVPALDVDRLRLAVAGLVAVGGRRLGMCRSRLRPDCSGSWFVRRCADRRRPSRATNVVWIVRA